MLYIVIAIIIVVIILLYNISGKVRDNFKIEMQNNETLIAVNDEVAFLGKNKNKTHINGIMYLTNRRILFFKHKYDWLNIIPFIGEAVVALFIDKNISVEIPVHQIKFYDYKPKITYREHGPTEQNGYTTFYTKLNEEYDFDIFVLDMASGVLPEILMKLEDIQKSINNPNSLNPN